MRILVITQYFWPEGFRINDLVAGLVGRGHTVTVLTGMPNYPDGKFAPGYGWGGPYSERYAGAEVIRVPLVTRGNSQGLRLAANYLSFAITSTVLGLLCCRGPYDAIFVFQASPVTVGIPARILSWVKRAPIFFWVQDLWPESLSATGAVTNKTILGMVAGMVRWIYRGCAVVLAQSRAFYPPLMEMDVPPGKIAYFPNSAEALYRPVSSDAEWDGPVLPDGFRVMFAGNLGAAQALGTLVEAADLLRDEPAIQWIVVGDGRMREWLANEVERRGLANSVHIMGRHPVESMPRWFAQADVMLASLSRDPIFAMTIPAKVQSYLACARPIIAAIDGEGARVVEEAGAGVGVPSEDAVALAEAVRLMSRKSKDELQRMGASGLLYFNSQFERELLMDRLVSMLEEHAGGRR